VRERDGSDFQGSKSVLVFIPWALSKVDYSAWRRVGLGHLAVGRVGRLATAAGRRIHMMSGDRESISVLLHMFNHAPDNYHCPFCALTAGLSCKGLHSTAEDIVCRDNLAIAFVSSHWWEKNPGHVLVVPTQHFENLYDLPDEYGAAIFAMSRRVATAIKCSYGCEGISTRQHNEPAGYQEVWHYHLHIFPRYTDDRLYSAYGQSRLTNPAERRPFANKLRAALASAESVQ
jgi:histidine triad (HIT) family protein